MTKRCSTPHLIDKSNMRLKTAFSNAPSTCGLVAITRVAAGLARTSFVRIGLSDTDSLLKRIMSMFDPAARVGGRGGLPSCGRSPSYTKS